jgi:hypothetical protein
MAVQYAMAPWPQTAYVGVDRKHQELRDAVKGGKLQRLVGQLEHELETERELRRAAEEREAAVREQLESVQARCRQQKSQLEKIEARTQGVVGKFRRALQESEGAAAREKQLAEQKLRQARRLHAQVQGSMAQLVWPQSLRENAPGPGGRDLPSKKIYAPYVTGKPVLGGEAAGAGRSNLEAKCEEQRQPSNHTVGQQGARPRAESQTEAETQTEPQPAARPTPARMAPHSQELGGPAAAAAAAEGSSEMAGASASPASTVGGTLLPAASSAMESPPPAAGGSGRSPWAAHDSGLVVGDAPSAVEARGEADSTYRGYWSGADVDASFRSFDPLCPSPSPRRVPAPSGSGDSSVRPAAAGSEGVASPPLLSHLDDAINASAELLAKTGSPTWCHSWQSRKPLTGRRLGTANIAAEPLTRAASAQLDHTIQAFGGG